MFRDMTIGDILFIHRIKVARLVYVSEVIDQPREVTRKRLSSGFVIGT